MEDALTVRACLNLLRAGHKRLVRNTLRNKGTVVLEACGTRLITPEEATTLFMLQRTPWYVRVWWVK